MNTTHYRYLLIFLFTFAPVVIFSYPLMLMIKKHFRNRRKALNCIGKDIPADIIRKDKGAKLAYKGIMKFLSEDYQKSAEIFEKTLKLDLCDENREFCLNWLAHCYYKLGYHKQYKDVRYRSVQALPTNDDVLMTYANCCADDGEFEKAEEYCHRALKYNPNNIIAYRTLGFMAEATGDYQKALKNFDAVLKIIPQDIEIIYEKALCYALLDENDKAQEFMKLAIANDSDNKYEMYKLKISQIRKINSGDMNEPQKESSLD